MDRSKIKSRLYKAAAVVVFIVAFTSMSQAKCTQLNILKGRVLVDGATILPSVTANQSCFRYLFVYLPEHGLFIVSNTAFEGGVRAGTFKGRKIEWSSASTSVEILSASQILGGTVAPAFVKADPDFKIEGLHKVVVALGSDLHSPYEWTSNVGENYW